MSFALIFIVGLALGALCGLIKLPKIIGMLAAGILIGPYVLNVIDPSVLSASADLRKAALVIILLKHRAFGSGHGYNHHGAAGSISDRCGQPQS